MSGPAPHSASWCLMCLITVAAPVYLKSLGELRKMPRRGGLHRLAAAAGHSGGGLGLSGAAGAGDVLPLSVSWPTWRSASPGSWPSIAASLRPRSIDPPGSAKGA